MLKIYIDKIKYSGKNNSFSFKLTILYDIYTKADKSQEILLKAFPTILTYLVLDYYYSDTSISTAVILNKVYELIQTYFKGTKYKKSVLSK